MLLSICVPSYNRGHRAYELVMSLLELPYGKDEIEIICSNNGSDKNIDGYDRLKNIQDERFVYHEFFENTGYLGNVNQVIKMSQGTYCMLLSDEDNIVHQNLEYYMQVIRNYPQISIIRSQTSKMYCWVKKTYAEAGEEALDAFYMNGNYVSGIFYNRKIITNALIDEYSKRYTENQAYLYYPHMFYDAYALTKGDYFSSDVWLIDEGEAEHDLEVAENGPTEVIAAYGTYEKRLEQMHGFAEQILMMEGTFGMKFQMFISLCGKTDFLIHLHKEKYMTNGYDWAEIVKIERQRMKEELQYVQLPLEQEELKTVHKFIDSLGEEP